MSEIIDWGRSTCLDGWLHRYNIVYQDLEGVLERCEICQKEVVFRIIDGRTENMEYLKTHLRQVLSPNHYLFNREYK